MIRPFWHPVSVPYRGATFLNLGSIFPPTRVCCCFRPLSGSYISQLQFAHSDITCAGVSVPYRGATFLNEEKIIHSNYHTVSVPYRGATFLNIQLNRSSVYRPFGVSVPYRGATFLNHVRFLVYQSLRVSVPYRGATFLN